MTIDELYEMIIHALVFETMTIQHDIKWSSAIRCGSPFETINFNIQVYDFDFITIFRRYGSTINIKRLI